MTTHEPYTTTLTQLVLLIAEHYDRCGCHEDWWQVMGEDFPDAESAARFLAAHGRDLYRVAWPEHVVTPLFNSDASYSLVGTIPKTYDVRYYDPTYNCELTRRSVTADRLCQDDNGELRLQLDGHPAAPHAAPYLAEVIEVRRSRKESRDEWYRMRLLDGNTRSDIEEWFAYELNQTVELGPSDTELAVWSVTNNCWLSDAKLDRAIDLIER